MAAAVINSTLEQALNLIGIFVFAISGALLAVQKKYDVVGMAVLAEITAIGGGVARDLILGATPPAAFTNSINFLLPLVAVAFTFFVHPFMNRIRAGVLVFDAAGLALVCVTGSIKALAYGMGPVEAVALGALTAVGGGVMRDVLANEQPVVLRSDSELYAIPAVLGGTLVVIAQRVGLFTPLASTIIVLFVFALRLAALRFHWRAPRPRPVVNRTGDVTMPPSEA